MPNGTEDPFIPSERRPWRPVTELDQLYDHGAWWCSNAGAHPDNNGGYPALTHVPNHECRSGAFAVEGLGEDDQPVDLEVYAVRPFRFGEARSAPAYSVRVALDLADQSLFGGARVLLSLGDALRVAQALLRQVEHIDTVARPTYTDHAA